MLVGKKYHNKTMVVQNIYMQKRLLQVKSLRSSGRFSCPTTIEVEKKTNPFLRCSSPEICETVT